MRRSLATLLPVVALGAVAPAACADTYVDTIPGLQAFAVPAGVTSLDVSVTGASGGDLINSSATLVPGGRAALVTGTVAVTPGQQLQLTVATSGGKGNSQTGTAGGAGAPDGAGGGWSAGGGGGATRVLSCQGITCPVAVIAAGGGGAGMSGYATPSFFTLSGGTGGAAGAAGGNGASASATFTGGTGGQPGAPASAGTGGSGGSAGLPPGSAGDAGANGNDPTGGAGGNQTNMSMLKGGGGGGGGVFGGGGGGSGSTGTTDNVNQAYTGGGGGGGGSSLPPSGGSVVLAASGATPGIVLTWTPPAGPTPTPTPTPDPTPGPNPGPSNPTPPGGGAALPAVSLQKLSPSAFPAAPTGASALAAKRRYGTQVLYTLNIAAGVKYTVLQAQPGRKARDGSCVKPTRKNRAARSCTRLVTLPGSFTRTGAAGANSFRFTGRLGNRTLKPGKYRLVATPSAGGKTGRAASASFQVIG